MTQREPPLYDVLGVRLAIAQRVLFTVPAMFSGGELQAGVIVALVPNLVVQRANGAAFTLSSPRRVVMLHQDSEPAAWLRRRLGELSS